MTRRPGDYFKDDDRYGPDNFTEEHRAALDAEEARFAPVIPADAIPWTPNRCTWCWKAEVDENEICANPSCDSHMPVLVPRRDRWWW